MLTRILRRKRKPPIEGDVYALMWGKYPIDDKDLGDQWQQAMESPEMPGPGYDAQTRRIEPHG